MSHIDLTNQRFGRLVAIEIVGFNKRNRPIWRCKCDCGNYYEVIADSLRSGNTTSCGCYHKELVSKLGKRTIQYNTKRTHGKSRTRLHHIWKHMRQRCINPNDKDYGDYGERGITLCDEWFNDFESFYNWAMENGYEENLTIDRINVDEGYSPDNCRWVTWKEQQRNKRNNYYVDYNGEKISISELAEKIGIKYTTLYQRLEKLHWSLEKAISTPVKERSE